MSNDYNGKKRSELPDSVFGIPQERKYPMPDEKHTRSAIKLFNHVDPKYEEQLAKAVIKNMKKYGIDGSVVGPNNRLRKYLPKDMLKESSIEEGFLKSDKDIYYNKDKFDSGEINLCFITGLSGSGKSTMGRNMSSKNIEHYEMDDVICNDNFSDDNLKEYGGLISSFFKGAGKSFRLIQDDDKHNDSVFNTHKNYEKEITQAFVKHAISYCKSHKETKYVCDGIWIFMFIKPEQLKDCAVYIKGTSSIKSGYRALKRDINEDKRNGMTSLQIFKHEFKRVKEDILYARENQKELKSFRSYFEKQSTNESVSSTVSKDHKQKGYISLSSLKKVHITESIINKYKKEYPVLRHVRCKDTNEYICDGYMWFKENDLVCYVGSCQYTDDHTKWIVSLEIIPKYRGYGLSNQILDYCVKSMKCKYLSVNKNNELAKKIYDKYGFRVYHEDNTMYYMTIDKSIKESSILPQDTGISTVIFDLGDVLVSANIKDYLVADPEVPNEIVDELLKLWFIDKDEVDDTMDLDTYREIVNKRMGVEFSKYIPKLFQYNVDCVTAFDYTVPMIQDLKDKGYKVYYLSNWSAWTYDLLQEAGKFDFLELMDGGVFSYDVGYMKPDEEIYKILLNKYKINPEEAVFFDDREENIEAANKLGIHGVHFPRHDSSIVYKNLFGYKLAKSIYEDINNIPYDFEPGRELEATYKLLLETNSMAITLQYEASKELMKIIKPVILEDKEFKNRAKELHLTLKCKLLPVKGSVISVLVLDGSQEYRDTPDARKLLNDIRASCIMIINKLSGLLKKYISKIDIGDGDEGCLYFHLNKLKAIVHDLKNKVVKEEEMDFPNVPIIFEDLSSDTPQINIQESIQEYGTTGGTIVGANQPDSVYIVNYMQNNVFSGYKEPKQAICKKGMNQMYTTKNGKAIPVDIDKFKEEASDVSVFRFKETPILSFDKIIENASVDGDFYMLLTGDYPTNQHEIEYDNRFVQEENFLDELDDITCCTESTITGQIETSNYPYMKVLTESVQGRCWNYYRDINGVFAMNELTGLRTPSYENAIDIPRSQIKLIERGTVYLGE